jgi:hypothetical protein
MSKSSIDRNYLSEAEIRVAMRDCGSTLEAAEYCNVGTATFRKYAKMYIDTETGFSLFELFLKQIQERRDEIRKQKNRKISPRKRKQIKYSRNHNRGYKELLEDILLGKHPSYNLKKLRKRVLMCGWIQPKCEVCGYEQARKTDGCYPLVLSFRNRNWRDCRIENLRLICFNCLFVHERKTVNQVQQGWSYGLDKKVRDYRFDGRPKGYGGKKFKEEHGEDYFKKKLERELLAREKRQHDAIAIAEQNKDTPPDTIFPKLEAWGRMTGITIYTAPDDVHLIDALAIAGRMHQYESDDYDIEAIGLDSIRLTDDDVDDAFDDLDARKEW